MKTNYFNLKSGRTPKSNLLHFLASLKGKYVQYVLTLILLCLAVIPGYSQGFNTGMSFGVNHSKLQGDWDMFVEDMDMELRLEGLYFNLTTKPRWGINIGLFSEYEFNKWYALRAELNYLNSGAGMKGEWNIYDTDINLTMAYNLNYLQIPILFEISPTEGFYLFAGPFLSFKTHANMVVKAWIPNEDSETERESVSWLFNSKDFGSVLGFGYEGIDAKIELRYSKGFIPVLAEQDSYTLNNSNIELKVLVFF
jgi:hypothetical protein